MAFTWDGREEMDKNWEEGSLFPLPRRFPDLKRAKRRIMVK